LTDCENQKTPCGAQRFGDIRINWQNPDVQAVKARADREMYRYKQERKRIAASGQ